MIYVLSPLSPAFLQLLFNYSSFVSTVGIRADGNFAQFSVLVATTQQNNEEHCYENILIKCYFRD